MLAPLKKSREAPKASRSSMETMIVPVSEMDGWKKPPFQREMRPTLKVLQMADQIKTDEEMKGVITLGKINGHQTVYVVDGQHRIWGARKSGLREVMADVRIMTFDTMADMADEYVRLNSHVLSMRPDDILRGYEETQTLLKLIRARCEFVGYDQVRRGPSNPILGMSVALRSWFGSAKDNPTTSGVSASRLADVMEANDIGNLITFLQIAEGAWGRDPEYSRLWGGLNLTMTMWMWRRVVKKEGLTANMRHALLTEPQFKKCLMRTSAASNYLDWLVGRTMNERDRAPCYARLIAIFTRSLEDQGVRNTKMPRPPWATNKRAGQEYIG